MVNQDTQDGNNTQETESPQPSGYVTKEEFKQLQEQITGVQIKSKNQSRTLEEKLTKQSENINKILEALSSSEPNEPNEPTEPTEPPSANDNKSADDSKEPSDLVGKIEQFQQNQRKALEQQNKQILMLQQRLKENELLVEKTKKEAIAAKQQTNWLSAARDLAVNPEMMFELAKLRGDLPADTEDISVNTGGYDLNADPVHATGADAVKHLLSLPQYSNFSASVKPRPGSNHIPGSGNVPPTKPAQRKTLKEETEVIFGGLNLQ